MTDWKVQQMIEAAHWPWHPSCLAPGADFHAAPQGGQAPLAWACREGKASLLKHLLGLGADVQGHASGGLGLLDLAVQSADFQTVMLLIDHLKSTGTPAPDSGLHTRLTHTFRARHTNARNRLQQTLRDWQRLRKAG